ncbi:MAG: hypothetical protein A2V86_13230 [Deltaproteobacteria bacterium RBG_16_49_23]|nr:MAG: hypothetical protein A2V86_13230 [Deltaproteobacteria bacterium RBG_16_49_23]
MLKSESLQIAAEDFRYLLNRGYPRKAALELVGNRYGLTFNERHRLHRGVFSDQDSKWRKARRISFHQIRNKDLAIDGHNVIITLEAGLSGLPLIFGDDGFIRDISGRSGSYRTSERTEEALLLIFEALKRRKPRHTLFLFDAPMSRSGELAKEIRGRLKKEGIPGDARAMKVPEKVLIGFSGIVATTDTAIIDRSKQTVDFAGALLRKRLKPGSILGLRKTPHRSKKIKALTPQGETK